jgi:hypothetical protein
MRLSMLRMSSSSQAIYAIGHFSGSALYEAARQTGLHDRDLI